MIKKIFILLCLLIFNLGSVYGVKVINVPLVKDDATQQLQQAIDEASRYENENVVIKLSPGVYNISRNKASKNIYYISNTASQKENPDPTKHIGLWFKNMKNITLDGNGATLLTHGEMTSFVLDKCKNILLKNFQLDAADPSVAEILIINRDDNTIEFEVISPSKFEVVDGSFNFIGEGWKFGDNQKNTDHIEFAQIFDAQNNTTYRVPSPLKHYKKAVKTGENSVLLQFESAPKVYPGERYQLRHGIRNEACMFINDCQDIKLSDISFYFMGNFGIVSQFSENLEFERLLCQPNPETERTNAGFADFLQFSSCKGLIQVKKSKFNGSQDDPINIHGTHLAVDSIISPNKIIIAYKHPQTFGFMPFKPGDEVGFTDCSTLNYVGDVASVADINQINPYKYELELDREILNEDFDFPNRNYVVENLSYTPDVIISENYFGRTPARGVLISTKGKSIIEKNIFNGIPMASILVADDASSWYESGPVSDLTIRDNKFINCSLPTILISPEIKEFNRPVHSNIIIENNTFSPAGENTIIVEASTDVKIKDNVFNSPGNDNRDISDMIKTLDVDNCSIQGNSVTSSPI